MSQLTRQAGAPGKLSRRSLLTGVAALAVCACMKGSRREACAGPATLPSPAPLPRSPMQERFERWLLGRMFVEGGPGDGFVYYYDEPASGPSLLSPAVTAKVCLYLLDTGRPELARRCGEALLRCQVAQTGPKHLRGGLPSEVTVAAGALEKGEAYYAGDNLLAATALHRLFLATEDSRFASGAAGACTFVVLSLMSGMSQGVWKEDHGAPMLCIRANGALVNSIHTKVELLWIKALSDVATLIKSPRMEEGFHKAVAFYRLAVTPSGAIMDHYDPGYPPTPYAVENWKPYSSETLIGDNLLRAALGFVRLGELERALPVLKFLQHQAGAVPGYLGMATGRARFLKEDPLYYDVVCTGMVRSLATAAGDGELVAQCARLLERLQDPQTGGWYWGVRADDWAPVEPKLATLTGLWAVHDFVQSAR